jgi:hypothetical protein
VRLGALLGLTPEELAARLREATDRWNDAQPIASRLTKETL